MLWALLHDEEGGQLVHVVLDTNARNDFQEIAGGRFPVLAVAVAHLPDLVDRSDTTIL